MKVTELYRTCIACPEQYEGMTDTGLCIYVRCRGGHASLWLGQEETIHDSEDNIKAELEWPDDKYKGTFEGQEIFNLFEKAGIELDPAFVNPYGHFTESQLSDLYYEEYKAEQYINEIKADGLL